MGKKIANNQTEHRVVFLGDFQENDNAKKTRLDGILNLLHSAHYSCNCFISLLMNLHSSLFCKPPESFALSVSTGAIISRRGVQEDVFKHQITVSGPQLLHLAAM